MLRKEKTNAKRRKAIQEINGAERSETSSAAEVEEESEFNQSLEWNGKVELNERHDETKQAAPQAAHAAR